FFFVSLPSPPRSSLFPYTTLFRSISAGALRSIHGDLPWNVTPVQQGRSDLGKSIVADCDCRDDAFVFALFDQFEIACNFVGRKRDRKSTRLNSSHVSISYAVFCLK